MIIGLGVLFAGYTVTYYGISQLRGQNLGFLDIVVPSRWLKLATGPRDQTPQNDDGTRPMVVIPQGAGPTTTDPFPR
jgi:predicted dienelactone hydrolase